MKAASRNARPTPPGALRELVHRFIESARERSEADPDRRRRAQRRHHRSWPLWVSRGPDSNQSDVTVALHNATESGLAFLASESFRPGTTILVRLFWHDPHCPPVPARIRHVKRTDHGFLVGCEFRIGDAPP